MRGSREQGSSELPATDVSGIGHGRRSERFAPAPDLTPRTAVWANRNIKKKIRKRRNNQIIALEQAAGTYVPGEEKGPAAAAAAAAA